MWGHIITSGNQLMKSNGGSSGITGNPGSSKDGGDNLFTYNLLLIIYYYYYKIYRAYKFKQARVGGSGVARWGT